jgi:hypothetical protein
MEIRFTTDTGKDSDAPIAGRFYYIHPQLVLYNNELRYLAGLVGQILK